MANEIARIHLSSTDVKELNQLCDAMRQIAQKTKVRMKGPIHLPTRRLRITTRKSPCGEGTNTWEKWEMRIHKRLIEMEADVRALREIIRINVSSNVHVEIELQQ